MYGYNFDFYEPGEDSYAFLDFLKTENIKNKFILDMGCSTCILTDLLKINNCVISLDKNIKALNYIVKNITSHNYNLVYGDLFIRINPSVFDIIIFNPPYVLDTETIEYEDYIVTGGSDGCKVINQFIDILNNYKINTIYLLIIKANNMNKIENKINKNNYNIELKNVKQIIGETLLIYKITSK